MAAVVKIEDLAGAVDGAIKGVINGLVRQKLKGIEIDPQDMEVQFSFNVVVVGGLNAIPRITKVTPDAAQKISTTVEPDSKEITVKGQETTDVTSEESGGTVKEESEQSQDGDSRQETQNGRTTKTTFEYEE